MNIGIIGSGISGLYLAYNLKKNQRKFDRDQGWCEGALDSVEKIIDLL